MLFCSTVCVVSLSQAQQRQQRKRLKGVDLVGREHLLGEDSETKAVVVLFLSTRCPVSNGYVPALNDLASTYRRRGVDFYGVISDPSVTLTDASDHRDEYHIQFPVLFDGSGELRLALAPTHTPQAFVLNQYDRMIYSGAIDDRHVKLGQKKEVATRTFLEDAIQAAVDGTPVAIAKTRPVGCLLEDPPDKLRCTYIRSCGFWAGWRCV